MGGGLLAIYFLNANLGLFTAPNTVPVYVNCDAMNYAIRDASVPGATSETRATAWTSDSQATVQWFAQDVDACTGETSERNLLLLQASPVNPIGRLQYAWGDNTKNKTIILNGRRMEITSSLDVVLRHLHSSETKGHNFGARRFWVDALSTNQNDELEKTWQVQQMSRIFHKAEYALVCLGNEADASDMAVSTVRSLGASAKAAFEPMEIPTLDLFPHLSQSPDGFGLALNALLQRTWWKRTWVVQEFAVSKDVVYLCADGTVGCEFFSKALDTIGKYRRIIMEKRGYIGH